MRTPDCKKAKKMFVVVGGGIAGLYAACTLAVRHPDKQIHVFEAGKHWGGRIYTVRKDGYEFEGGAGRIGSKRAQPLLWALLKWLGLRRSLIQFSGQESVTRIVEGIRTRDKVLQEKFGYDAEFELLDPEFARTYLLRHFQGPFFLLGGGLDQIPKKLVEILEAKENVTLHLNTKVVSIRDSDSTLQYFSSVESKLISLRFEKAIVCVTKSAFEKLFFNIPGVQAVELNRIFVRIRDHIPDEFKQKRTGPGPVRMWIPMGGDLYQIYTDSHWALWWKEQSDTEVERIASEYVGVPVGVVVVVDREFWREGVHFCGNDMNFNFENVLVAGEMVAQESPGWIEGALESVKRVLS